jgi:hypothetical protein
MFIYIEYCEHAISHDMCTNIIYTHEHTLCTHTHTHSVIPGHFLLYTFCVSLSNTREDASLCATLPLLKIINSRFNGFPLVSWYKKQLKRLSHCQVFCNSQYRKLYHMHDLILLLVQVSTIVNSTTSKIGHVMRARTHIMMRKKKSCTHQHLRT